MCFLVITVSTATDNNSSSPTWPSHIQTRDGHVILPDPYPGLGWVSTHPCNPLTTPTPTTSQPRTAMRNRREQTRHHPPTSIHVHSRPTIHPLATNVRRMRHHPIHLHSSALQMSAVSALNVSWPCRAPLTSCIHPALPHANGPRQLTWCRIL